MYKKAIDILMSSDIDYKAIVISIAKTNPSIIVKAVGGEKITATKNFTINNGTTFNQGLFISDGMFATFVEKYGFKNWLPDVLTYLFSVENEEPKKIKAIKAFRNYSGEGLKNSKFFIEELIRFDTPDCENLNYDNFGGCR